METTKGNRFSLIRAAPDDGWPGRGTDRATPGERGSERGSVDDQRSAEADETRFADRSGGRLPAEVSRARAARDRERAAEDREQAASLRAEAARDRAEAERERHAAGIDHLTGVTLQSLGLSQVEREIERSRRTGRPLVLALVEVNNLRDVNDKHGHHAGDVLLRRVGDMLGMELRSYDVIVRSGGDEFICTLDNIETKVARRRFKDIIGKLERNGRPQPISFGLARLKQEDDLKHLVTRAAEALVEARRSSVQRSTPA